MNTKKIILLLITSFFIISCGDNNQKTSKTKSQEIEQTLEKTKKELEKFRPIFENKIVVLLNKEGTDLQSNNVNLQTYINEENIEFIPIFTSNEKILKSTGGVVLGNEMEMDGYFFLSQRNDSSSVNYIRINPALSDDRYAKIDELKEYFEKEILEKTEEIKAIIE